ncbi:MAG TPA: hypothetical protein VFS39_09055 [Nitrospira sp.]|nr:hypothetical protein [Nitrospira sp.]
MTPTVPVIWAAISGHGFGHAAQVVPVLNALQKLVPGLSVVLRTSVPASFFQDRLAVPWSLQAVQQDVGCIQRGPLRIDVPATWSAHDAFHESWEARVQAEQDAMREVRPCVVIADTPYLALYAGAQAGFRTVGLANFTWDEVLAAFEPDSRRNALLARIRAYYGAAELGIRLAPGLSLSAFRRVCNVGPIADPARPRRAELRAMLKTSDAERLVLVAFGGIPLNSLPWKAIEGMEGYHFIVDGIVPPSVSNVTGLASLPYSFKTILASVDVVMTKPGYGTVVEAVAAGLAVLYVRRYNFADEASLVDYLHRHGNAAELLLDDFEAGRWKAMLAKITQASRVAPPPRSEGAQEAAAALAEYF